MEYEENNKNKTIILVLIGLLIICIAVIIVLLIDKQKMTNNTIENNTSEKEDINKSKENNTNKKEDINESKENEEINNTINNVTSSSKTLYYSIEKEGKFTPSDLANKVDDYKKLKKDFFIKETITKTISNETLIEVLLSYDLDDIGDKKGYYTYNYFTEEEFNKKYQDYIKKGLKCDGKKEVYVGEGSFIKCKTHEKGFEYDKIESENCVLDDEELICIKPNNSWAKIEEYKKEFETKGWTCEISNYNPKYQNNLECMNSTLRVQMHDSGEVITGHTSPYCYVNSDLASWCYYTGEY